MALYHLDVKIHSRGKGGANMLAAAAYRAAERLREPGLGPVTSAVHAGAHVAGERLADEHGRVWDYTSKAGVLHSEIVLPDGAPDRFRDRQTLWAAAEKAERRRDAQVGREFVLTLPRELDTAANVELVRSFVRDSLAERGMAVDFAVHQVRASDGLPHVHAHVLCAMRRCDGTGFTTKDRGWNARSVFNAIRHEWQDAQNHALEQAQVADRVDCRSLQAQLADALAQGDLDRAARLDREPVPYMPRDTYFTEKAHPGSTELGRDRAETEQHNADRAELYASVRATADELPDAAARFLETRSQAPDLGSAFDVWSTWAIDMLDRAQELARDTVGQVRDAAVSAWDNLVAAMSPMSDFALAERAAAEEHEAELDRLCDEVLAEMEAERLQPEAIGHEQEAEELDDLDRAIMEELADEPRRHEHEPPGMELEI